MDYRITELECRAVEGDWLSARPALGGTREVVLDAINCDPPGTVLSIASIQLDQRQVVELIEALVEYAELDVMDVVSHLTGVTA